MFVLFFCCLFVFGSVEQFCLTDKCDAAVEVEVAVETESEVEVEAVATATAPQKSVNPLANSIPSQILLLLDCSETHIHTHTHLTHHLHSCCDAVMQRETRGIDRVLEIKVTLASAAKNIHKYVFVI